MNTCVFPRVFGATGSWNCGFIVSAGVDPRVRSFLLDSFGVLLNGISV